MTVPMVVNQPVQVKDYHLVAVSGKERSVVPVIVTRKSSNVTFVVDEKLALK